RSLRAAIAAPQILGRRAPGQQPGDLHAHAEGDCPGQRLTDAHLGVVRIVGRFLSCDPLPAEGDELTGAVSRGNSGGGPQRPADALAALVCPAPFPPAPAAACALPSWTVDHPPVARSARAAGLPPLTAAARSAG